MFNPFTPTKNRYKYNPQPLFKLKHLKSMRRAYFTFFIIEENIEISSLLVKCAEKKFISGEKKYFALFYQRSL